MLKRSVIALSHRTPTRMMRRLALAAILVTNAVPAYTGSCNVVNGKAFGDCQGVKVNTGSRVALVITTAVAESGMINGAVVKRGGSLQLSGMSVGDITVEAGAMLEVNGTVNGTITNNGGKVRIGGTARSVYVNSGSLEVSGMVDSIVGNGTTTYKSGAVIGGKPVP